MPAHRRYQKDTHDRTHFSKKQGKYVNFTKGAKILQRNSVSNQRVGVHLHFYKRHFVDRILLLPRWIMADVLKTERCVHAIEKSNRQALQRKRLMPCGHVAESCGIRQASVKVVSSAKPNQVAQPRGRGGASDDDVNGG